MKLLRIGTRIAVGGLALLTLAGELVKASTAPTTSEPAETAKKKLVLKTVFGTLIAAMLMLGIGGLLFMASGLYEMNADEAHIQPVRWFLRTGRTRSVEFHSRGIRPPINRDASKLSTGLQVYVNRCQPCHGGPGIARHQLGRGINPTPPPLITAVHNWSDAHLYWIISHGLKMSGMPSFSIHLSDTETWALVSFLRRLPVLSPTEYTRLASATAEGHSVPESTWNLVNDLGFSQITKEGSPERGRELVNTYGCRSCHDIPGVHPANGRAAPPLTDFAERQYIAGALPNVPANAIRWIVNPQEIEPGTAMPNLNVDSRQALEITSYLYTLGNAERLDGIRRTVTAEAPPEQQ